MQLASHAWSPAGSFFAVSPPFAAAKAAEAELAPYDCRGTSSDRFAF
jgi:hypothetical protein